MAGLYSKNDLGEVQLNLKDALQKLYKTGIQEDLRLFAFANSIYSEVRSGVSRTNVETGQAEVIPNEIKSLINEPFTNESGQVIQRTKFVTNKFAFSSNNLVYFEKIGVSGFDQRTQYVDTVITSDAIAGSAGHIRLPNNAVFNTQKLIGNDGTVYYILDNAAANTDFRISTSANGSAITNISGLLNPTNNLTASGGAAIRDPNPLGAPVVVSENGSIVSVQVSSAGSGYEIERTDRPGGFVSGESYIITDVGNFLWSTIGGPNQDADGNETAVVGTQFTASFTDSALNDSTKSGAAIRTLDSSTTQTVDVNVIGERSGASNAVVRLKITNGSISRTDLIDIVNGGSGYFADESLKPIRQCRLNRFGQQETPQLQKCKNYSDFQDRLIHRSFKYTVPTGTDDIDYSTAVLGYEGSLVSGQYLYETKDAGEDGFFLYDPLTQKDLYLGQVYDQEVAIGTGVSTPSLLMRRFDTITSLNLLNIASLDSASRISDYDKNIVDVNSGYARNFLIPQKKAAFASDKNIAEVEAKKDELAAISADILTQAKARAKDLEGSECEILVPVTEEGALYGSVGTREISEAFIKSEIQIDKSEVQLPDGPLKETGEHNIVVSVHPEVNVEVLVKVSPE